MRTQKYADKKVEYNPYHSPVIIMNTLIIKAHPRTDGFTHRIAESYKSKMEKL